MRLKDFDEFARLLASDEHGAEIREILSNEARKMKDADTSDAVTASLLAIAVSRQELRKYHEWLNSQP